MKSSLNKVSKIKGVYSSNEIQEGVGAKVKWTIGSQ